MDEESYRTKAYKLIICGDGYIGKTSLRKRFFGEGFKTNYSVTLAADFAVKKHQYKENDYVLHIWDVAGQPSFKTVRGSYYKNASGLILMFDLSNEKSFLDVPKWLDEFSENSNKGGHEIPIILIGNKVDLRGRKDLQIIDHERGVQYAKELSEWSNFEVPYVETSALSGINVDIAFNKLIGVMDR